MTISKETLVRINKLNEEAEKAGRHLKRRPWEIPQTVEGSIKDIPYTKEDREKMDRMLERARVIGEKFKKSDEISKSEIND